MPAKLNKMQISSDQKLISCILPHGIALDVIRKLKDEKNIVTAYAKNARGMGRLAPLEHRGVGEETEKEILYVVVPTETSDELFEYIFDIAEINRPHGGIIYMCNLQQATPFFLPDLPEEQ